MRSPPVSRALSAALLSALALAGIAATAAHFYLRSSVSAPGGTVRDLPLGSPVTVHRDSAAIPHIFASTEGDAHFAQGYLHASDRLWQMELFHRIARGRLSEVFGERTLEVDRFVRTLGLWESARRGVAALEDPEREALESYAAGVNAAVERREGALPPEFLLLRLEPEPWTPEASAAIGKIMALNLSTWRRELSRFRAARTLPPDKFEALRPSYPDWGPTILDSLPGFGTRPPGAAGAAPPPPGGEVTPSTGGEERAESPPDAWKGRARTGPAGETADPISYLSRFGLRASNAWAVSGARTAPGTPLLANDMHLALESPSLWYLNALHAGGAGASVAGLSIPGAPGVVVGYNRGIAWGFTNGMIDDMDFFVEEENGDGSAYRTASGWESFAVRPETIRVRGRDEPVVHEVRETARGPVVSDVLAGFDAALSVRWAAARPTSEIEGLLRMNRADDPEGFDRAIQRLDSPQQNVVFAATDGSLGYRLSGGVPRRPADAGTLPARPSRSGELEAGFWPPDSLPGVIVPPGEVDGADSAPRRTYLASANNLQAPGLFGVFGVDYALPFRARRIVDLLDVGDDWTVARMAELQRDSRSLLADQSLSHAVAAARRAGADSAEALLREWDRDISLEARAPGLFYAWIHRLRVLVAADEFRSVPEPWRYFPLAVLLEILEERESPWLENVITGEDATLDELEERAMRDAIEVTGLRPWGALNRERSVHPLGRVGWLDRLFRFDVGPYPVPGAARTVRAGDPVRWGRLDSASWVPPWENDYGPSQRFVASLGPDEPRGYFLLPTGQSGNPISPHYRNMSRSWRTDGVMIPVPIESRAVEARARNRLRLLPPVPETPPR